MHFKSIKAYDRYVMLGRLAHNGLIVFGTISGIAIMAFIAWAFIYTHQRSERMEAECVAKHGSFLPNDGTCVKGVMIIPLDSK